MLKSFNYQADELLPIFADVFELYDSSRMTGAYIYLVGAIMSCLPPILYRFRAGSRLCFGAYIICFGFMMVGIGYPYCAPDYLSALNLNAITTGCGVVFDHMFTVAVRNAASICGTIYMQMTLLPYLLLLRPTLVRINIMLAAGWNDTDPMIRANDTDHHNRLLIAGTKVAAEWIDAHPHDPHRGPWIITAMTQRILLLSTACITPLMTLIAIILVTQVESDPWLLPLLLLTLGLPECYAYWFIRPEFGRMRDMIAYLLCHVPPLIILAVRTLTPPTSRVSGGEDWSPPLIAFIISRWSIIDMITKFGAEYTFTNAFIGDALFAMLMPKPIRRSVIIDDKAEDNEQNEIDDQYHHHRHTYNSAGTHVRFANVQVNMDVNEDGYLTQGSYIY